MPPYDDVDTLISELSASLEPPQHAAFEAAARSALAGLDCAGPGLAYRILGRCNADFLIRPTTRV